MATAQKTTEFKHKTVHKALLREHTVDLNI